MELGAIPQRDAAAVVIRIVGRYMYLLCVWGGGRCVCCLCGVCVCCLCVGCVFVVCVRCVFVVCVCGGVFVVCGRWEGASGCKYAYVPRG